MTWRTIPRLRKAETAASKWRTRWAQLAQAKVVVIAPSNGSEHFAQNGGTIRETFASHSPQRYSPKSTDVKHATASGTIPTRRFFPSHGSVTNSRRAILLKTPLLKIQPACKPIGSQSERVCNRASARIQPIRNKVVNPAATRTGSVN